MHSDSIQRLGHSMNVSRLFNLDHGSSFLVENNFICYYRMLDMGFGPQIEEIINASEMPPKTERVTLMFSATFPDEIQQMAQQFLNNYLFLTVGRVGGTCSDVQQTIIKVPGSDKRNTLENILQESGLSFFRNNW